MARDCVHRLDFAYQAAFRRCKAGVRPPGFPRFRRELRSLTYIPTPSLWIVTPGAPVQIPVPKIGPVRVRRHREPPLGTPKSVTIDRESTSRWFVTVQYELPDPPLPPDTEPSRPVGIDLGLRHLPTLSSGEIVEPPHYLARSEKRLGHAQRQLARKKKGSHRHQRQRERVARIHATVRRQRRDFAHRLTSDWAKRHDLVAFEDTDFAEFREGNRLANGMADAGWGRLRQMAEYKLALRSGRYVEVAARGTTQTCSSCGRLAEPPLTLKDRVFRCPCGLEMDRDLNAARNILQREISGVRRNTAELKRVERTPPPTRRTGRRAYLRKREGSPTTAEIVPEGPRTRADRSERS